MCSKEVRVSISYHGCQLARLLEPVPVGVFFLSVVVLRMKLSALLGKPFLHH